MYVSHLASLFSSAPPEEAYQDYGVKKAEQSFLDNGKISNLALVFMDVTIWL
jgi:hypothetical protein